MARTKWVTRTVTSTKVKCLMLNTETGATVTVTYNLSGDWTEVEKVKLDREIRKKADENGEFNCIIDKKPVKCNFIKSVGTELVEKLYWMDEQKFIANADKITDGREAE